MKKLLLTLALVFPALSIADEQSLASQLINNAYFKFGVGYKFNEAEVRWVDGGVSNTPVSARFELATQYKNFTFGYSHHSQVTNGAPFNNNGEYFKDEIFIDYKLTLGDLFK